jgi:hypothetical protein
MNFLEVFNELDNLNEEVLTEKCWVVIKPNKYDDKGNLNDDDGYYYKFLTVDDNKKWIADITNMLSTRKGTYKQTLNKNVLSDLITDLNNAKSHTKAASFLDPNNYTVQVFDKNKFDTDRIKVLTLADRALRQSAHKALADLLADNPDIDKKLKEKSYTNTYLIHHINGNEYETTLDNIILIPYFADNKYDLKVANGIHGALHGASKKALKTSAVDYTTPLFYVENGKLIKGECRISLTLKPT